MKWLVPPVLFALSLTAMILLRCLWPVLPLVAYPYNLLGIIPILLGFAIGLSGAITFRKLKTNIRPFKQADMLVAKGPFRYTRNPMYLGLSVVLLGVWLLLNALSPLLVVLIFVVITDRWYIASEERMMHAKFGAAFDTYRSKVRRWF